MPIDMPLSELKKYMGSSPCPEDFDDFWDRQLKLLDNIEPNAELIPASFESRISECFDLWFTSVGGARIHAKFLKPKGIDGKIPLVIRFHGLSGTSRPWCELLQYVSEGYCVADLESRGQGGYSEDRAFQPGTTYTTPFVRGLLGKPEELYYRDVFLDGAMLNRVACSFDFVDPDRVAVTGESQGGGLAIACAGLCENVKVAFLKFPYLSDFRRVYNMNLSQGAYAGLDYFFRYYDPTHEHEDEIFMKLGYIDAQNFAHRFKAKTIMGSGLSDTCCPPSTHFAVFNKIPTEKVIMTYPEYGHEELFDFADHGLRFLCKNL